MWVVEDPLILQSGKSEEKQQNKTGSEGAAGGQQWTLGYGHRTVLYVYRITGGRLRANCTISITIHPSTRNAAIGNAAIINHPITPKV